jgi:hypothetical protein
MANPEHLEILKQGVEVWNRWREENFDIWPDLRGANLRETNLTGANLSGANLREANLSRANLWLANLRKADLHGANLYVADFSETDLREAKLDDSYLHGANLRGAHLRKANLRGADLSGASLVYTELEYTDLTGCSVYGVSVWKVKLTGAIQKDLVITDVDEPVVMVDDLEVAQFVYLLLHHDKLRNVLNAITEKGVLILGRFGGGGLDVLRAMADRLRDLGYLPIIFDFERPRDRRYTETVKTLVGMARFAIVDLSGPSVPQELYATVPFYKIPFIPILEAGRSEYSLFADLLEEQNVLKPVIEFDGADDLLAKLPNEIVGPAENYVVDRQKLLAEIFGRQG